jgi:hypothetical protein
LQVARRPGDARRAGMARLLVDGGCVGMARRAGASVASRRVNRILADGGPCCGGIPRRAMQQRRQ